MRSSYFVAPFAFAMFITAFAAGTEASQPLGRAFTYQGQLLHDDTPTTGTCDLQFSLYDAASGGNRLGNAQTVGPVSVTDGLFTVQLNGGGEFGADAFNGDARWLQMSVSCPSSASPSFTVLAPRQDLTGAPYALYARTAGSMPWSGLTGLSCATGQVAKWNGSAWTCTADADTLGGLSCSSGQVAKWTGAAWSCAAGPTYTAGPGLTLSGSAFSIPGGGVTNSMLASSSITVTAGPGLSGGGMVALGGTTTLSNAGVLSVQASAPLAVAGTQHALISLSGQMPIPNGGTGANTAAGARSNLGAASSGANSDITSLSGISGNIKLPESTATAGNILKGDVPFIHNFGTSNTFLGELAGNLSMTGGNNTAVGIRALGANTNGNYNTAVGNDALLKNASGGNNTALGSGALHENLGGIQNTAVGAGALFMTSGNDNTAVGKDALLDNTSGELNVAVGEEALENNTTGNANTAVGQDALQANTDGELNVALGGLALFTNTSGSSNTAVGHGALYNTTGNYNIGIGVNAGVEVVGGSNNIDIGNGGQLESNTIRIGRPATHTATYIAGISDTPISGNPVYVTPSGKLGVQPSSASFKEDIEEIGGASEGLMRLRPVRFRYKHDIDPSGLEQYGLLAEEVATVYPDLVANDADGHPYTVRYQFLAPMLLNEVQKQAREIAKQKEQITTLTARLEQVEAAIAGRSTAPASCRAANGLGVPRPAAASF